MARSMLILSETGAPSDSSDLREQDAHHVLEEPDIPIIVENLSIFVMPDESLLDDVRHFCLRRTLF